jgi:SP family general alpha glucoside:H+ symporter-like MFS transporter
MEKGISTQPHLGDEEIKPAYTTQQLETSDALDVNIKGDAFQAENAEHAMGLMEAVKLYPMACFWAFVMSFTIVMESFDMFLVGNFVALPAFKNKYGTFVSESEGYVVPTRWQTALTQAGQIGALLGIFICGPIANRYGYRVSTIVGLICMNATIFISFFGNSLPVFLVGQLLEGIPWGFFIANSPAYASEISPLALRSVCTAYLQMCSTTGPTNGRSASHSPSSGSSQPRCSYSCSLRRNRRGGSSGRDATTKLSGRSSALDARPSRTRARSSP